MSTNLADSTANFKRLVHQIMRETDSAKYDEPGSEIWRELLDREHLTGDELRPLPDPFKSLEIVMASLRVMESTLLGMKQLLPYVGTEIATEMLDSLIHETESQIVEIKQRVIN
jgi:hypothetical protein